MSHPHPLSISAESKAKLEGVHPRFLIEGLLKARQNTMNGLDRIRQSLREGMTEDESRKLALGIFAEMGVTKHWHRPFVRFGPGTTLTFNDPIQPEYRLKMGDPYYIDLGPVWHDHDLGLEYEGDYGDTFIFGENPEALKCAELTRQIFTEAKSLWSANKGNTNRGNANRATGQEIYAFIRQRAQALGYLLADPVQGHRLGDFPHHKHGKETLARLPFVPTESLWVLEVQLLDPQKRFGAFFEDLL